MAQVITTSPRKRTVPGQLVGRIALIASSIVATWFIVTFLYYPNVSVVLSLFMGDSEGIGKVVSDLFGSARVVGAIRDTLIVAAISVVTVNIVGVMQVLLLEAIEIRGRAFLKVAFAVPLVFGSVAAVTGYSMVYGTHGFLTQGLRTVIPTIPDTWFSGMFAVIFVHTFTMTGYHFLFLRPAIRRIDFSMVEAARSLGMGPVRALTSTVLPILRSTILAAVLMVLIGAIGSFAAPNILGGGNFTMVGPLINALTKLGRPDMAALLGIALAAVTVGLLVWALGAERKGAVFSPNKSAQPFRRVQLRNPALRTAAYVLAYALALINLAPLAVTLLMSLSPLEAIRTGTIGGFTLEHYARAFTESSTLQPILNSLLLCAIAIPIALLLGTMFSHFLARSTWRVTDLVQVSLFLPYFLPGVLIALGFLVAFGVPNLLIGGQVLVGSFWILPLAYIVILLPTVVRFVGSTYAGMDPSLDDAARSLGASPMRRYFTVVFPVLLPVLFQVAALSFNQTFDEYTVSVMLYNVNNQPLGVAMGALASSLDPTLVGVTTTYVVLTTLVGMLVILFADRMAARASEHLNGTAIKA